MSVRVSAQEPSPAYEGQFPFIIITSDTVTSLPALSDEEFYRRAASVYFVVNRTDIRPDDEAVSLYRSQVLPLLNDEHYQLRKVFIRGAASPEGSYENNRRLGQGRSAALLRELSKGLEHQYMQLDKEVSSITEDYGYLCLLMKEAGDPDYETVKAIFDSCDGDEKCCKQKLMAHDNGRLWRRLLQVYYPRLRSARVVLWFSRPDEKHAPVRADITPVEQTLPEICLSDLPGHCSLLPLPEVEVQPAGPRRHMIAVRTNLVHDFFYMPGMGWTPSPNVQLEYYPLSGHMTYNLGMTWGTHRKWKTHEFMQVRDFQFELRRYFRGGGRFLGPYLAAHLHGDVYGIGLDAKKGWEGEGGAASLSVGHVMKLTRRGDLRLEFMAEAGFFLTLHDPYVYGNPFGGKDTGLYYYNYLGSAEDFRKRNHMFTWFGPLNVGVQLTYDIIYRKRQSGAPKRND